jgi:DNA-binding response OmpR family regulator
MENLIIGNIATGDLSHMSFPLIKNNDLKKIKKMENSVLVIDDDQGITELLNFVLSRAGFRVITINDGFNACRWLLDNIPDVIICDILMPEMSGTEVLAYIRNIRHIRNVPVLALTSLVLTGYREKFLKCGFDAYFPKPINIEKFGDEVRRYTRSYFEVEKVKKTIHRTKTKIRKET